MIVVAALLLAAAADSGPVRRGPARVCLMSSSFDLLAGETAQGLGGGPESVRIEIDTGRGRITYAESDIFAEPAEPGALVATPGGATIRRSEDADGPVYLLYGPGYRSNGRVRYMANLHGPALHGDARDAALLARWHAGPVDFAACRYRYVYGWEYMLEDGPAPR